MVELEKKVPDSREAAPASRSGKPHGFHPGGLGLRPWLILGLAAFVVVLVLSVGLVALWALEQRVQVAERGRMSATADAMASLAAVRLSMSVPRPQGSTDKSRHGKSVLGEVGALLKRFVSLPGVLEVGLTVGNESFVAGGADLVPLAEDGKAAPLRSGLVTRRDIDRGGLLIFYRRVPSVESSQGAVLRLVVDRRALVKGLLGGARKAFWGLAAIEVLLVVILAGVVLTRTVTGPLVRLETAARAVAQGDLDQEIVPEGRGEIRRLFGAFSTMTRHLRQNRAIMEEQIRRLSEQARSLEAKQAELDASWQHVVRAEKFATVGRLAAGVAHEVGNPLTALLGYLEMLRDPALDQESAREFLVRMEQELRRMDGIIRGLLDYSRSSTAESDKVSLAGVVRRAAELLLAQKRYRGVAVEPRVPDDLFVLASENRLVQVMVNLFVNAADAMEGNGRIFVEAARGDDGTVELWVCDEGPGVPEDLRESIFDPFFTTKEVGDGTGLGLAVSRSLMETMEGRLELAGRGKRPSGEACSGACFRLSIQTWKTTDPPRGE